MQTQGPPGKTEQEARMAFFLYFLCPEKWGARAPVDRGDDLDAEEEFGPLPSLLAGRRNLCDPYSWPKEK